MIKLGVITALALFAFWFVLLSPARDRVNQKVKNSADLNKKIATKKQVIQRADQIKADLQESGRKLQIIENQMVTGDMYRWIIKTLRSFEIPQQIEFSKYDPPQIIEPQASFQLPYQVVSYAVTGTATFHDLGEFVERFENTYSYIRIHRLEMEPATVGISVDEKLSFLMELHVMVKPEGATSAKPTSNL